jgi:hypothetical protein
VPRDAPGSQPPAPSPSTRPDPSTCIACVCMHPPPAGHHHHQPVSPTPPSPSTPGWLPVCQPACCAPACLPAALKSSSCPGPLLPPPTLCCCRLLGIVVNSLDKARQPCPARLPACPARLDTPTPASCSREHRKLASQQPRTLCRHPSLHCPVLPRTSLYCRRSLRTRA